MKNNMKFYWEEFLDSELDKWLETEEHRHHCIACSEGQYCCLDNESSPLGGKIGRDKVKELIKEILKHELIYDSN